MPKKTLLLFVNDAGLGAVARFVKGGAGGRVAGKKGNGRSASSHDDTGALHSLVALATTDSWSGQGLQAQVSLDAWLELQQQAFARGGHGAGGAYGGMQAGRTSLHLCICAYHVLSRCIAVEQRDRRCVAGLLSANGKGACLVCLHVCLPGSNCPYRPRHAACVVLCPVLRGRPCTCWAAARSSPACASGRHSVACGAYRFFRSY